MLTNTPQWVAVYTAPRSEKKVTAALVNDLHMEAYLPLRHVLRKWSDRMKRVEVPLIPSYTFVKMTEGDFVRINSLDNVCGFVKFHNTGIAIIPQREIEAMRRLVESEESVYVHNTDSLKLGAPVHIVAGHFAGLSGTIVRDCKDGNFGIHISGLNIHLVISMEKEVLQAESD